MGTLSIYDISGRAMAAQMVRMNTTASNLANAGAQASSESTAYHALKPVFQTIMGSNGTATVGVSQIVSSAQPATMHHDPNSPLADQNGNVWEAAVDPTSEMVEMMETSRQYENNVQVLQTANTLTLDTLRIGQ
ncbi:MAG: flagellar basal body rod protein FlgC [Alphaproteobacteria bacterium]|nr:flagellar basal body rod protein FlgC [Alphaproteobacteria bacterium]